MSDTPSPHRAGRLRDHVTGEVMRVVNRLVPGHRTAHDDGAVSGCLQGCIVTVIAAITLGIVLLVAATSFGRAALDRGTSGGSGPGDAQEISPDVGSRETADDTDLAVIDGPWRIRNEELAVGGVLTPYTTVERGTFSVSPDGRLVGTSEDGGDLALGFDLVSSSPTERVYTTTFMGAVYTLRFDDPGHFVGEVVLDGVLGRRIEGWSELDEDGDPRPGLPDVDAAEPATEPVTGPGTDGDSSVLGIAASCGADWLPSDLALPFTTFEPGVARDGEPACVGTYVADGFGSARSVLVVQSGMLGLDYFEESDSLLILGCTGDVGPLRFELTTAGASTEVVVSIDRRGCDAIFG